MRNEAIRRDETVHALVLAEFDRDPNVPAAHVGVAVTDELVILSGTVRHDRDRLSTVDAASRFDGVRVIVDAIAVGDNGSDFAADHAIANQLVQILESAPQVPAGITLQVRNKVIALDGVVGTAFDRQTVRRLAEYPAGVNWVRDNLVIRPRTCEEFDPSPLDSSALSPTQCEISTAYTFHSVVRLGHG